MNRRRTFACVPRWGTALLLILCWYSVSPPPLAAQPAVAASVADPACPAGNLLAGRRPWAWSEVRRGPLSLPTDGVAAPEGASWDGPVALLLDTGAATVTWDIVDPDPGEPGLDPGRRERRVHGLGLAGRQHLAAAWGASIRSRAMVCGHGGSPSAGPCSATCASAKAWATASTRWPSCSCSVSRPRRFRRRSADGAGRARAPVVKTIYSYWNDETSARWELVLAGWARAAASGATAAAPGRGAADAPRSGCATGCSALLGVLAALTYVNFGSFHFGNFIHDHEWTHYYLGSKYFHELSYDRLYECLSVADVEAGLRRRVELRQIINLRTNVLGRPTQGSLAIRSAASSTSCPSAGRRSNTTCGFSAARTSAGAGTTSSSTTATTPRRSWNLAGRAGQPGPGQPASCTALGPDRSAVSRSGPWP